MTSCNYRLLVTLAAGIYFSGAAISPSLAQGKNKSDSGRGKQHKSVNQNLGDRDYHGPRGTVHKTLNSEWDDDRDRRDPRRKIGTPGKWKKGHTKNSARYHSTKRHEQYSGELRRTHNRWHDQYGDALKTAALREQHRRLHEDLNRRHRDLR